MGSCSSKSDGGAQSTNKPEDKKTETAGQTEQTEEKPAGSLV